MKKQIKIILGVLVVLLGVNIAIWLQKGRHSAPIRLVESDSMPPTFPLNPAQLQPVAQQPHPVTASNTPVSTRKKFDEMGVLEERAILKEIAKQDLPAIFKAMLDAERVEHDQLKQMHLQTTFENALMQKTLSPEFLEQLRAFVTNTSNSQFERELVLGALGSAATPDTVKLLAQLATTSPLPKIREAAGGSLGEVGSLMGGGEKLSPTLERVWRESTDEKLLITVSMEMAKIGAPSSIELLLSAALATDEQAKLRHDAAQRALLEVYRATAVPPLAARLANQPPTSEAVKLVAPVLARIGDPAASKAVVGWLQGRSENAAPLIHDYIRQRMLGDPFQSAWAAALDPAVTFLNEENRKAIRDALDAYRAGRTSR